MPEIVKMPKLGFDMAEGTLVRWLRAVGEDVNKGDVLAEIETDKATVEVESSYSGVVNRLLVEQGAIVPVGDPIAVIAALGEEVVRSPGWKKHLPQKSPKLSRRRNQRKVRRPGQNRHRKRLVKKNGLRLLRWPNGLPGSTGLICGS